MRLHTGAKPFKCPHCDMRFRTSGHRKGHLLQHFKDPSLRNHRTRRSGFASDDKRQPDDPSNQQLQVISDTNSQLLSASDSDLLTSGQNLLPISLTLSDAFGSDVSSSVAQLLEGMQLQIGGQGFQITGIDTSLGTQPIHIDASAFLQHISNTVNLMNPNLLSGVQAVDLLTVSGGMATNGDALNSNDDSVCLQSQDMTDVVLKNDTELTAANTEREEPTGVNDLTDVTEDDEDNGVLEDKLTDNDDAILNDRLQSTQPVAVIHYCPVCYYTLLSGVLSLYITVRYVIILHYCPVCYYYTLLCGMLSLSAPYFVFSVHSMEILSCLSYFTEKFYISSLLKLQFIFDYPIFH